MPPKYLSEIPKPLLDELIEGRWLPVVGAGMSRNAIAPGGKSLPLWDELGRSLAAEIRDYDYSTAIDAISAYEQQFSRVKLVERLSALLFVDSAKPGAIHKAFCSINFPVVCTTNFDFLLEKQYDSNPRYCRPIMYEKQLSLPSRGPGVQLLKLHGDVHHPERLIATEEDYDGFLQRYPLIATYLANLLITKTAVFIGYSLDDPDFRQVFRLIADRLGSSRGPAYTIRVNSAPQEIARFERRGVKVISLPGRQSKYGEILTALFEELREYQESALLPASRVTDEQALREIVLPRGSTTRLSFFAVPFNLMSLYKESIFPIAQQFGFVPITAESVVSPGDSTAAKIDALLAKASVCVVDVSNDWTRVELQIAWSKLGPNRVLVISDRPDASIGAGHVLKRPRGALSESEQFLQQVSDWFATQAQTYLLPLEEEPDRLLEMGYSRAAVIAATTLLETRLRERLNLMSVPNRPMGFVQLVRLAVENGALTLERGNVVNEWAKLRNLAVHTAKTISMKEARIVVHGIKKLIDELKAR